MPPTQSIVFAVAPGGQRLGIAVFAGGHLLYYGGKSLSQYASEELILGAAQKILTKTFAKYRVTHLALKKLVGSQKLSLRLVRMANLIKQTARDHQISIREYEAMTARAYLCQGAKRATREETARRLIEEYPELARYRTAADTWEKRYYGYIFEAVAGGAFCVHELKKKAKKLK